MKLWLIMACCFWILPLTAQAETTPPATTGPSLYYVFLRASRVALLPFVNVAEVPEYSAAVMTQLRKDLAAKSVELADSAAVAGVLRKHRIRNTAELTVEQIQALSDELDVSYLLVGTIDYVQRSETTSEVALSARLIYLPSVQIAWAASASAHTLDQRWPLGYGFTRDMPTLIRRATDRLLATFRYARPNKARHVESLQIVERGQDVSLPCRSVLVLPFANETITKGAGYALSNQFTGELLREGFALIEPARVKQAMLSEGGLTQGTISTELRNKCRDEMGVDFILTGTISTYGTLYGQELGDDPRVEVQARLIDTRTGVIVWAKTRAVSGSGGFSCFGFGFIHSLHTLSRSAVRTLAMAIPRTSRIERLSNLEESPHAP